MIFISAQPDNKYFIWQLEIQIFNFRRLGIKDNQIHILFGYRGTPSEFLKQFIDKYSTIGIYYYHDDRIKIDYIPSVRPLILKKHFEKYPNLENEIIFYHDSDIIFRKLPNFEELNKDEFCYTSDTISYIGAKYITSKGDFYLKDICDIVGIDKEIPLREENNSGGAQYILKGIDYKFWEKVNKDCIDIYKYMLEKEVSGQAGGHPIQKWCADMWALLYNLWFLNKNVKVTKELSFSWGTSSINEYEKHNIYHNAGVVDENKNKMFYKGGFITESPFKINFDYVSNEFCNYKYVEEIKNFLLNN